MDRNDLLPRTFSRLVERFLVPLADRLGWSPDRLTWAGLAISGASALAFALAPAVGAGLLLLAGLCDATDGLLARARGTASKAGAFLDSTVDRYSEILIFAGLWGHFYRRGDNLPAVTLIVLAAMAGSLMVSYTRARGEGLGVTCAEGVFQRPERILVLALAGFVEPLAPGFCLLPAVALVAVGANLTAASRLRRIRRQLLDR